jgi:hypothetical protein
MNKIEKNVFQIELKTFFQLFLGILNALILTFSFFFDKFRLFYVIFCDIMLEIDLHDIKAHYFLKLYSKKKELFLDLLYLNVTFLLKHAT